MFKNSIAEGFIQKRRQRSSLLLEETKLLQLLAVLAILHQDGMKNRMNSSVFSQMDAM